MTECVPTRAAHPDAGAVTYPVSYAQESLLDGVSESAITVPAVARVGACVRPAQVQQALEVLVARHDALRTVFGRSASGAGQSAAGAGGSAAGAVVGHVRPFGAVPLTVTERRTRPADLLARVLLAGAERPFVLAGAPPARAELHLVGSAGGLVVLWLHHAISDLVSVQVLAEELGRLLRGSALAEPGRPMAEVAAAERAVRPTARQRDYWAAALDGADAWLGLPVPAGTPHQLIRPALPRLAADVVDRLGRLAADHRTTVTTVLAAAVLAAHAGDAAADTAVLGLTVSNRDHPQLRSTVAAWPTSCRWWSTSAAGRRSASWSAGCGRRCSTRTTTGCRSASCCRCSAGPARRCSGSTSTSSRRRGGPAWHRSRGFRAASPSAGPNPGGSATRRSRTGRGSTRAG